MRKKKDTVRSLRKEIKLLKYNLEYYTKVECELRNELQHTKAISVILSKQHSGPMCAMEEALKANTQTLTSINTFMRGGFDELSKNLKRS